MILTSSFEIQNDLDFIANLTEFSRSYEVVCILNSNNYNHDKYSNYQIIAAFGVHEEYLLSDHTFSQLSEKIATDPSWIFGHFSYNLKNQLEDLHSKNEDFIGFSPCYFFKPQLLIKVKDNICQVFQSIPNQLEVDAFLKAISTKFDFKKPQTFSLEERTTKEMYLKNISKIKEFIKRGDIYEMNYCVEYFNENVETDPYNLYFQLNNISPNPFSAFYKNKSRFLICASPERYICKRGDVIVSQPIKGTSARGITEEEDKILYNALKDSKKENAENIMITDLVRNDLSKIAEKKSVEVEELCEIYAFPQVFQMISTIKATKRKDITDIDVIKATFPMGSMTGAPKISACKIIDQIEDINRGLYSGSVGYFDPEGNFDFNVVIRSLQYNQETNYLSYMAGSAITWASDAEKEYEECRLKAASLDKMF